MDFSKIQELETEDFRNYLKDNSFFLAAVMVFLLALYLRYLPANGMKYLQALDPYVIFRYSQHVALDGNLPITDFMRYFPYNLPVYKMNQGDIFIPAIMYWLGPFLFFDYLSWGQFYPAFMGALGVLLTYFLGKEIFDKVTGLSAAFFLAVIPGVLHRSSAGFFEKEPTGTPFMLVSMLFFVRAWKRQSWKAGIVSGVSMAAFTMSWGGAKMLWLLYPMIVGLMLWLNEDIRSLVVAYTPTVIIGGGIASMVNPFRFWFTQTGFIVNIAMLGFLWSRYLFEQLELIDQEMLKYYTPGLSLLGVVALILSPLYSSFVAKKFIAVIKTVTRSGSGDVVSSTVAENTAATLGQVASQLGAFSSSRAVRYFPDFLQSQVTRSFLAVLSNLNGPWPLAFIGIVLLGSSVIGMIARKIGFFEQKISALTYYKLVFVVTVVWTLTFSVLFQDSVALIAGPPVLAILGGMLILYSFDELEEKRFDQKWYYLLPLCWAITNILAAVTQSRLIFLSAFPAAFMAGYSFSLALKKIWRMETGTVFYLSRILGILIVDYFVLMLLSSTLNLLVSIAVIAALNGLLLLAADEDNIKLVRELIEDSYWKPLLLGSVVLLTFVVNFSAGFANAQSLGGSPNQLWMDNLEYMEQNTEKGSVILSWWDYGYWFESIGRRAAIADGGNSGFYTDGLKINFPLADFLTSTNPGNYTDFLKKHSVDYIVLDQTMIGKYSAVSTIHKRGKSRPNAMIQLRSRGGSFRSSLSRSGNKTVASFSGRGLRVYTPIEIEQKGRLPSVRITSAPTVESRRGRSKIDCLLTENGKREFNTTSQSAYCLAKNPYYSFRRAAATGGQAKIVLVPKEIQDATLVRLYLQDGHGVDYVEKVEKGSNGYVKMWKVNLEE